MNDKQSTAAEPRLNGAPQLPSPMSSQPTIHVFSARERAFFVRQIQQMNALQAAVQTAIALVIEQQELEGNWRLRPDGSGLERIDPPPAAA